MSTGIIGAIIMTHGDDNGLVLPPAIAPIQLVIVPVAQHKPGVLEKAAELRERLSRFCRVKMDDSDNSPGWKFAEYEMKGVPLRLEIGPRDIEANQCVLVRRDNREKTVVSLDDLETKIPELLQAVRDGLYQKALANRERRTFTATTFEEMKRLANEESGFIETMWCGTRPARTGSRRRPASPAAACPMSRSTSPMSARSAAPGEEEHHLGKAY